MAKPVTLWNVWESATDSIRNNISPIWKLGAVAIILPNLLTSLIFSLFSQPIVSDIQQLFNQAQNQPSTMGYHNFLELTVGFLASYAIMGIALILNFFATYLAFIHLFLGQLIERTQSSPMHYYKLGWRSLFPKGILLLFGISLITTIELMFFKNFVIFSIFALMSFVIMIAEKRRPLESLGRALFFRYTSPAAGGGFTVGLILVIIILFAWMFNFAISWGLDQFSRADEALEIQIIWLWSKNIPGLPFTLIYLIQNLIQLSLVAISSVFVAALTTCLFFQSSRSSSKLISEFSTDEHA